jgi:3-oxoacyl-[acyl-carrier-protein] synthase-1
MAVALASIGVQSALGLSAAQTAFLFRAGFSAMDAAPLDVDGEPLTMCWSQALSPDVVGAERLARLAARAALEATKVWSDAQRVRLYLCVDARQAQHGELVARRVASRVGERVGLEATKLIAFDETGACLAMREAIAALEAGAFDVALVGGVHSDLDRAWLLERAAEGRLLGPGAVEGIIAGEGAAFVSLATPAAMKRASIAARGELVGTGLARETSTEEGAAAARALTKAVHEACEPLDGLRAGWMLNDVGPESWRLLEWQSIYVRAQASLEAPHIVDAMPLRLGALGAATMPMQLALALEGWRAGWAPSRVALTTCAAESGDRAAMTLCAP